MSASFSIEKPSVLALLPRPIDRSNGRYVVSDVHGGIPGSRKRKRSELAIGVDGEGLNIYNTRSSKLVASYSIPPQSSFSCAPSSVRSRTPGTKSVERRTYISSKDETARVTLFRDFVKPDGTTESSTASKIIEDDINGPVIFLDTISDSGSPNEDIVLLRKSGQILCLNGLDLNTRWTSPASVFGRNTATPDIINHKVDFAELTNAHHISTKLLNSRGDLLSVLPQEISKDGYNPPILVVITTPDDVALLSDRTLHILALPNIARDSIGSNNQSVHTLLSISLPWTHQNLPDQKCPPMYSLNSTLGVLYELYDYFLVVIDLEDSQPKVRSRLYLDSSTSFLVLSSSSVLAASTESLTIYHPAFQSVQASITVKSDLQPDSTKRKSEREIPDPGSQSCLLVAYSPKQSTAYAIAGNDLLAFHIDYRQDVPGQRRATGLLLHSLSRGVTKPPRPLHRPLDSIPLASFGSYTAGSDINDGLKMDEAMSEMDKYVVAQDVEAFERVMARMLGVTRFEGELKKWEARQIHIKMKSNLSSANGIHGSIDKSDMVDNKPIPCWRWPTNKSDYPEVDPKWADYALSRIFSWSKTSKSNRQDEKNIDSQNDLAIVFYPHNVVHWLIETGCLTRLTVESALRQDSCASMSKRIYPGQLVMTLSEVDPEFEMLLTLLSYTFLDAPELLQTIRLLMQSLELFGETPLAELPMLTNGDGPGLVDSELQATIETEQENADRALVLAEHRLEDHSSIRGRALSLALVKLSACPIRAVVAALRSMFSLREIISLIYLLRFELARGAWTSKYLDVHYGEEGDEDVEHDNSISLVSSLLNRCVDAIGAGGWLAGDVTSVEGDMYESEELITTLKLEVSAALEGVEEASYLKGLTAEMVRYGEALKTAPPPGASKKRKGGNAQPIILFNSDQEVSMLPIGLKAEKGVSPLWMGAGGEMHRRSAKELRLLRSKKVGRYSRERINI